MSLFFSIWASFISLFTFPEEPITTTMDTGGIIIKDPKPASTSIEKMDTGGIIIKDPKPQ
ncbi:MAG: hypothetical protein CMK64_04960 [Pseudoalteromonas sp.]|nr:hypothetical protein [Pseudoalteromonas sp.]|tara:strand:+ start:4974 stop:5153 length:180 start_codon:yes stop_codon:yes gene_type:complete